MVFIAHTQAPEYACSLTCRQVYAARPRIESLAARLRLFARGAHSLVQFFEVHRFQRGGWWQQRATPTLCQRHGLAGLHVCVLVEREAREREGRGGDADERGEEAAEREQQSRPEERTVAPARHLADGEARVRRRVRQGHLAPDHEQVYETRRAERPRERRDRGRLKPQGEGQKRRRAEQQGLYEQVRRQQSVRPQVARLRLRAEVGRVNCPQRAERKARQNQPQLRRRAPREARREVKREDERIARDDERAFDEPTAPVRARE